MTTKKLWNKEVKHLVKQITKLDSFNTIYQTFVKQIDVSLSCLTVFGQLFIWWMSIIQIKMPSPSTPRNLKGHTKEQFVLGKDTHYNGGQHSSLVAHRLSVAWLKSRWGKEYFPLLFLSCDLMIAVYLINN